eukprot:SAG11_NODE_1205_length_5529_cov_6.569797_4_plen_177_part_00
MKSASFEVETGSAKQNRRQLQRRNAARDLRQPKGDCSLRYAGLATRPYSDAPAAAEDEIASYSLLNSVLQYCFEALQPPNQWSTMRRGREDKRRRSGKTLAKLAAAEPVVAPTLPPRQKAVARPTVPVMSTEDDDYGFDQNFDEFDNPLASRKTEMLASHTRGMGAAQDDEIGDEV